MVHKLESKTLLVWRMGIRGLETIESYTILFITGLPRFLNSYANVVNSKHDFIILKTHVAPMVLSLKKSGGNWYLTKRAASGGTSLGI